MKSALQGRKVDYLIINHDEPDHSSSIAAVIREWPEVQVVGNAKTFAPLEAFYGPISGSRIALHQDKQLELAHAVRYCDIKVQYTQRRRSVAHLLVL